MSVHLYLYVDSSVRSHEIEVSTRHGTLKPGPVSHYQHRFLKITWDHNQEEFQCLDEKKLVTSSHLPFISNFVSGISFTNTVQASTSVVAKNKNGYQPV